MAYVIWPSNQMIIQFGVLLTAAEATPFIKLAALPVSTLWAGPLFEQITALRHRRPPSGRARNLLPRRATIAGDCGHSSGRITES